jgi:ABC-type sugar transport system ATPase subunit
VNLLQLRGVTKIYPGVTALDAVDFSLDAGTVHALVGENGAGKSTLLRVIAGATKSTSGETVLEGRPVVFDSPRSALQNGITVVYQELTLVPHLGADANVFLGMEPSRWGFLDLTKMRRLAENALQSLGFDNDPGIQVARLSVAQRQLVEIARALVRKAKVIALDEPTATLTPHETDHLFTKIQDLKSQGVGVIFVSHRLEEVRRIADAITVLRDGQIAWTGATSEIPDRELIRAMVGRDVEYLRLPPSRSRS